MNKKDELFEAEKTFGLGVLLKLTKMNFTGIQILTKGNKFTSNVTLNRVTDAVNSTIEKHNIQIKYSTASDRGTGFQLMQLKTKLVPL